MIKTDRNLNNNNLTILVAIQLNDFIIMILHWNALFLH